MTHRQLYREILMRIAEHWRGLGDDAPFVELFLDAKHHLRWMRERALYRRGIE